MKENKETAIVKGGNYVTEINFFHVAENNQGQVASIIKKAAEDLVGKPGFDKGALSTVRLSIVNYHSK